jgi:hypothetical protein
MLGFRDKVLADVQATRASSDEKTRAGQKKRRRPFHLMNKPSRF